jgi:hypothetical protein
MASLSNISLTLTAGSSSSSRNATVGGTMTFDAGEVGKSYRLAITLMGEDKAGDKLPSGDAVGDDTISEFTWGSLLPKKAYKDFTVSTAGAQTFSETRAVTNTKLDEDPGQVKIGDADINTPVFFPRQDEVYASVTLSGTPSTARSPTVIAGVGV